MAKFFGLLIGLAAYSLVSARILRYTRETRIGAVRENVTADHASDLPMVALASDASSETSAMAPEWEWGSPAYIELFAKQQPADAATEAPETLLASALLPEAEQDRKRKVVWIAGYPRSATSTLLSLVSAGERGLNRAEGPKAGAASFHEVQNAYSAHGYDQAPGKTFSLFEPCHFEDNLGGQSCSTVLKKIANCDFSGIVSLAKWADPHTTNNFTNVFEPEAARRICQVSDVVAFKTISVAHPFTEEWLSLIEAVPTMQVISVVRDPRAIYASWKSIPAFQAKMAVDSDYSMMGVCQSFLDNTKVSIERLTEVTFEELMRHPRVTVQRLREWLQLPYEKAQEDWVGRTFDATDCPEQPKWFQGYDDCHTNSAASLDSWRGELTQEEMEMFANDAACTEVATRYGYEV